MVTKEERLMNLLSMAARARRIVSGAFAAEKAMQEKKAVLLVLATDAAAESKQKFLALAEKYKVPYLEALDRDSLGGCLGKDYRAVAVLTDAGFARKLQELAREGGGDSEGL